MNTSHSPSVRNKLTIGEPNPFIGIYDVLSASVAHRHYDSLFVSGFGFGASHYGLPDAGFITWTDLLDFVLRLRRVVPEANLLVDIDDGYGDSKVACHVTKALEQAGAFGVVLEDQRRPRRCGHLSGKQILPLDEYLLKLEAVVASKKDLFVIARTDASEEEEIIKRVKAFEAAGADAVLADGITSFDTLKRIRESVSCPIAFNQIAGGKSPDVSLEELKEMAICAVIYSTPCLFAAHQAIEESMQMLAKNGGSLSEHREKYVQLKESNEQLDYNLIINDRS